MQFNKNELKLGGPQLILLKSILPLQFIKYYRQIIIFLTLYGTNSFFRRFSGHNLR